MTIKKALIRGFRCFDRYDIELNHDCTVIAGPNASGKTSLLEAFHVAARLRSFRTPTIAELIKQGTEAFSVRMFTEEDEIHVAYGDSVHIAEINGIGPATRGRLMQTVSVVTITEQDLDIVQGYPEGRRLFLDQTSVTQKEPEAERILGRYYQIHRQRAALLNDSARWNRGSYEIITQQTWRLVEQIRSMRQKAMRALEQKMAQLLQQVIPGAVLTFEYKIAEHEQGIISPEEWCKLKEHDERRLGRSLMGSHLDDMEIIFQQRLARRFASRGMQKIIAVLMKVAQAKTSPHRATLLLDDLLADFDEQRLEKIMGMLNESQLQVVFAVPTVETVFSEKRFFNSSATWIYLP